MKYTILTPALFVTFFAGCGTKEVDPDRVKNTAPAGIQTSVMVE